MSETLNHSEDTDLEERPDELAVLKQRARLMGITFSNNIGLEALKLKVASRQEGEAKEAEETPALSLREPNPLAGETEVPVAPLSIRQYLQNEQLKLIRIRITNLDPKKKELPGEIFTVANEYIGTQKKYVPYGEASDDGWHVPFCIYEMLLSRRFLDIRTGRDAKGQVKVTQKWVREFAIEVLEPLSRVELNRLAATQAAAGIDTSDEE